MTRPPDHPTTRRPARLAAALLALAIGLALPALRPSRADAQVLNPVQSFAESRQVTVFGILATPGDDTIDPRLKAIAPQLRRLFPEHGFKLLGVETERLRAGQTVVAHLGDGIENRLTAGAQLVNPLDPNGKVQIRFELNQNDQFDFATVVNTPLNQLFFLDKRFPDTSRLIIGIGVRE